MIRILRCLALGVGLLAAGRAENVPEPRRFALKIQNLTDDQALHALLPGLEEALRSGLKVQGVDLVFGERSTPNVPLLKLYVGSHGAYPWGPKCLEVSGWIPTPDTTVLPDSSSGRAAACATFSRDAKEFPEALIQAAQAVVRELLAPQANAKTTSSEPTWVAPLNLTGFTRVEGKEMRLEGAAPPLDYPWEARERRVGGPISLDVQVDRKGRVLRASILEGHPLLVNAALVYVANLRFQVPKVMEERAPLVFGVNLRYGLPPISKVSSTVLEVVDGSLADSELQPELAWVKEKVSEMLKKDGVRVVSGNLKEDAELRHLRITVDTLRGQGNLCAYGVRARLSAISDRSESIQGGPAHPVLRAGLVVGQRGEIGLKENILQTLQRVVRATVIPPHPELFKPELLNDVQTPSSVEFEFSSIKIKRQPPAPRYPESARQRRIQGEVVISIELGEDGIPQRAVALKGPPELLLAAVAYALDWTFEPARINGEPVRARFKLTMPFRLR